MSRTGWARRILVLTGADALSRPAVTLMAATVVAGLAVAGIGLALPVDVAESGPLPAPLRFVLAGAAMAAAQLARLRLRVGTGVISITWSEAALLVCLCLVPATWLPAATFVGAALAWLLLSAFDRRTPAEAVSIAATLTVAVALAVAVVIPFGDPSRSALTPGLALLLVAAALAYLLATTGLAALTLTARYGLPVGHSLLQVLRGKLPMFVRNVAVGLAAVALLDQHPLWLLTLPPALWLLQRVQEARVRADGERRAWRDYADAVRALNQLDEHAVAMAGVAGVLQVLGAQQVDLAVMGRDGTVRRYRGDSSGAVAADAVEPAPDHVGQVLRQPLVIDTERVGELQVRLPRPVRHGPREAAMLSAFGDALAAALHGAVAHRERAALAARSSYEAERDPLTRLLNRAALLKQGDAALRRLDHAQPVALVVLDLDNFNEVNETLGHFAGDELLKLTADRLRKAARPDELLARIGGDEFALLVTGLAVVSEPGPPQRPLPVESLALRRARQIAELLADVTELAGVRISAETSIGVAAAQAGGVDMAELLRRADIALHQAKQDGGLASYDQARDVISTDRLMVLAELREALAVDDQLVLALQPAVDLRTGAPTGVEALIRWHHPRRGRLNPVDFIGVVEGSDLLAPFTRYVIDKALAVAADWGRHNLHVPVSVNLSARSLLDPRLPVDVAELLRRHQVPAQQLVLEITETVEISDLDVIDEVLDALHALGVQLAVDDFGTGFSSLAFLTRVSVDELKVDRSFVMRMADSPKAAAVVRATVELGRELGLRVVAEGVETAEQRLALAELGCAAAQGYHFFRPMSAEKVVGVLRSLFDSAQARVFPLRADGAS